MSNTYLVCSPTSHFADDVHTNCAQCHAAIVHRPIVPVEAVKICSACAAVLLETHDVELRATEETLRELALYYAPTERPQ